MNTVYSKLAVAIENVITHVHTLLSTQLIWYTR